MGDEHNAEGSAQGEDTVRGKAIVDHGWSPGLDLVRMTRS
jgi:hypothetical protein